MMMLLTWLSTALALTPGGFRVDTAQPVDTWSVRNVLIVNPGDEVIDQLTPRVTKVWGKYGLDAELSGLVLSGTGGTIFGGVGSLRSGHWYVFKGKKGAHHRLGAEIAHPIAPDRWRPQAYGSSIQDTLIPVILQMGWRVSWNEKSPWEVKLMGGGGSLPWWDLGVAPLTEISVVKVLPLSEKTSVVLEQDFLFMDWAVASFRPTLRFDLKGSTLDAGLQIPWGTWALSETGPRSVQVVLKMRQGF